MGVRRHERLKCPSGDIKKFVEYETLIAHERLNITEQRLVFVQRNELHF